MTSRVQPDNEFKPGHIYYGEFKDPYNAYKGIVFSINGFLEFEGIKFYPKNPFFKCNKVSDITSTKQLKILKKESKERGK